MSLADAGMRPGISSSGGLPMRFLSFFKSLLLDEFLDTIYLTARTPLLSG